MQPCRATATVGFSDLHDRPMFRQLDPFFCALWTLYKSGKAGFIVKPKVSADFILSDGDGAVELSNSGASALDWRTSVNSVASADILVEESDDLYDLSFPLKIEVGRRTAIFLLALLCSLAEVSTWEPVPHLPHAGKRPQNPSLWLCDENFCIGLPLSKLWDAKRRYERKVCPQEGEPFCSGIWPGSIYLPAPHPFP